MAIYLTADWHLGDPRMEILNRPFPSAGKCLGTLLGNFNKQVKKDDSLIIVGDVCYDKAYLPTLDLFNGQKTLIRGNHDKQFTDTELRKYFDVILPEGEGLVLTVGDPVIRCLATHYPTRGKEDYFNLVGHIHACWRHQLNMLNVGVDANHFLPVPLSSIPKEVKAITSFYDEDVWVAYNDINQKFQGLRGKEGSYLKI